MTGETHQVSFRAVFKTRWVLCVFLYQLGAPLAWHRALAQAFAVEGHLACRTYRNGTAFQRGERSFSVVVDAGKWQIETRHNSVTNRVKSYQAYYDGTNIFFLTVFQAAQQMAATNQPPPPKNDSLARVLPGAVPDFDLSFIQVVWLAYCSSDILRQEPQARFGSLLGIGGVSSSPEPFLSVQTSTYGDSLQLPRYLVLWNEGRRLSTELAQPTRRGGTSAGGVQVVANLRGVEPPFDSGYTNAVYESLEPATVEGYNVPLKFKLRVFQPKRNARSADELTVSMEFEAEGSLNTNQVDKLSMPTIGSKTLVLDRRAPAPGGTSGMVAYWPTTNNRWLTAAEIQAKSQQQGANRANNQLPKRLILIGVFSAATVAFAVTVVSMKKRRQNQGTQTYENKYE